MKNEFNITQHKTNIFILDKGHIISLRVYNIFCFTAGKHIGATDNNVARSPDSGATISDEL